MVLFHGQFFFQLDFKPSKVCLLLLPAKDLEFFRLLSQRMEFGLNRSGSGYSIESFFIVVAFFLCFIVVAIFLRFISSGSPQTTHILLKSKNSPPNFSKIEELNKMKAGTNLFQRQTIGNFISFTSMSQCICQIARSEIYG